MCASQLLLSLSLPPHPLHSICPSLMSASKFLFSISSSLPPPLPLSFSHSCFSITPLSLPHPFTPSVLLSFLLLNYSSLSLPRPFTPSVLLSFLLLHYSSLSLSLPPHPFTPSVLLSFLLLNYSLFLSSPIHALCSSLISASPLLFSLSLPPHSLCPSLISASPLLLSLSLFLLAPSLPLSFLLLNYSLAQFLT